MEASRSPAPFEPGTKLGRYELLCEFARGGMATVWLARLQGSRGFERFVAIKTMRSELAADDLFQRMFLDEATLASRIDHPNVARILDLGELQGELFMVMEYVEGDSLATLRRALDKQQLKIPAPILLRILADTCAGLHAAHELADAEGKAIGLVHRDVSPQNILLSSSGAAKVIDFGIAKARSRIAGETRSGFVKGKLHYMPPEQALATGCDRRADVWAVGAVAYDLLEGVPVFDGPSEVLQMKELLMGKTPTRLKASIPRSIEALIVKALSREPDERFASAAALRDAMEDALFGLKLRVSVDEVAAFVKKHVGTQLEKRRALIERAIDAASERGRLDELLRFETPESSSRRLPAVIPSSPPPGTESVTDPAETAAGETPTVRPPDSSLSLAVDLADVVESLTGHAREEPTLDRAQAPTRRSSKLLVLVAAALVAACGAAALIVLRPAAEAPKVAAMAVPASAPMSPPLPLPPATTGPLAASTEAQTPAIDTARTSPDAGTSAAPSRARARTPAWKPIAPARPPKTPRSFDDDSIQ